MNVGWVQFRQQSGAVIPVSYSPKNIINVFCVPKKDSETGEMTKLRVVRHGSYSTKDTTSINDWIDKQQCKMPTLPNLKDYIRLLSKANYMALRDLKDAFRQIPLAKRNIGYLGYSLFGLKMIDVTTIWYLIGGCKLPIFFTNTNMDFR